MTEETKKPRKRTKAESTGSEPLPVMSLKEVVLFPRVVVPLFVGRERSVRTLSKVLENERKLILVPELEEQADAVASTKEKTFDDLMQVGTVGEIIQMLKLPDGTIKILVRGEQRVALDNPTIDDDILFATPRPIETKPRKSAELRALMRLVLESFETYTKQRDSEFDEDLLPTLMQADDPALIADSIAHHLRCELQKKQQLLELTNVSERLELLLGLMRAEVNVLRIERRIRSRVKKQMERSQREYYLTEQMKAIQSELKDGDAGVSEQDEYQEKIDKLKLTTEAREKAVAELKKLKQMNSMSSEAVVIRNYLDWLLGIPWKQPAKVSHDLRKAEKVLNEDHFGLEKVKDRILEYLAVQSRTKKARGTLLCLVGPPGVGKTSLGTSIARATGRPFIRMALGGVRDEAEIRGHRRTYLGSLPGKIVQGMKKAGKSNPLFLLDEIDKLGHDWRGDPTSALLEVLDPEQNVSFNDHYLEVDYDLSDVLFVTTANGLNMPQPLLDRLEIINISGYTEGEKVEIAKRHLVRKQTEMNGLKKGELEISDPVITSMIQDYTREAGVRNLERQIAKLSRKALRKILDDKPALPVSPTPEDLNDYLGVKRYRHGVTDEEDQVGVINGLAWTGVGGEILTIEGVAIPGKGKVTKTGKLGDVMQESVEAAHNFVKSRMYHYGIGPIPFEQLNVHLHVPEGATPKDGPSAGVAMVTCMVSVYLNIPVHKDVAMTGEVTLRGRVLPIGGLKEKLLAATRGGVKTVIIPADNEKDLVEISDNVKDGLTIIPVKSVDEVLKIALTQPLTRMEAPAGLPGHQLVGKLPRQEDSNKHIL